MFWWCVYIGGGFSGSRRKGTIGGGYRRGNDVVFAFSQVVVFVFVAAVVVVVVVVMVGRVLFFCLCSDNELSIMCWDIEHYLFTLACGGCKGG